MPKSSEWEKRFDTVLNRAGLEYRKNVSVRISKLVEDRRGNRVKTVATPDRFVLSPDEEFLGCYVEVTRGNGNTDHKGAQERVLSEAKVNYKFVSSGIIQICEGMDDPVTLRVFLLKALSLNSYQTK